jgi:tetratricopeptide (TPR) repeat protein
LSSPAAAGYTSASHGTIETTALDRLSLFRYFSRSQHARWRLFMEELRMPPTLALLIAAIAWLALSSATSAQLKADRPVGQAIPRVVSSAIDAGSDSQAALDAANVAPKVQLAPVAFDGLQPGIATAEELAAKWGAPVQDETQAGTGLQTYQVAPFKKIDVTLSQGKVVSIVVQLAAGESLRDALARFVPIAGKPVDVQDGDGAVLGVAFPEQGVVFAFAPGGEQVSQVLFDPIDYESFFLRAQRNQHIAPLRSLADLEFVLEKHGKYAPALALAAQIFFAAGQLNDAAAQIDAALAVEPSEPSYLLTKAEILAESGDFAAAEELCAKVLGQAALAAETKARALCLTGDFFANGPKRNYHSATEYHTAAIRTAQPLLTSRRASTRRAAKHVLICAQLGMAGDIAWGHWQQKEKVVPKWLAEARETAEDLIEHEQADESLRFLVLRRALAASAGTQGKLDPVTWTKEAITSGRHLVDSSEDPWRRGRIEWELGLALYDALQADQARGYHQHALSNSKLVLDHLEAGLKHRQATRYGDYLLGRLYFRIGAIHAVDLEDHATAVNWFQKALPLLDGPLPATAAADVGLLGESYVSMGISFWESNQRERALGLTNRGIELVRQGVAKRVTSQDALAVPYANLAFMHRELGHAKEAENFAQLATRLDGARRQ